jgi:hypothetical protein
MRFSVSISIPAIDIDSHLHLIELHPIDLHRIDLHPKIMDGSLSEEPAFSAAEHLRLLFRAVLSP